MSLLRQQTHSIGVIIGIRGDHACSKLFIEVKLKDTRTDEKETDESQNIRQIGRIGRPYRAG
jgi:hypothetical protein